jgi:hypothetical protein
MSNNNDENSGVGPEAERISSTEKKRAEISDRHQLFAALFLGLVNPFSEHHNSRKISVAAENRSFNLSKQNSLVKVDTKSDISHSSSKDPVDGVLSQIEQLIPHDPMSLRQSSIYKGSLQLLQWQRDNYLVGGEYADWRRDDRIREQRFPAPKKSWDSYSLPYDTKAISHDQLSSVASAFIPTKTVQDVLTPVVTGLFDSKTGVLFGPIRDSIVSLILDQQTLLDQTVKDQVLAFLDNPRNRDAMKVSTEGMIIQTTRNIKDTS